MIAAHDSIRKVLSMKGDTVYIKSSYSADNYKDVKKYIEDESISKNLGIKDKDITSTIIIDGNIISEKHDTIYILEKDSDYIEKSFSFSNKWRTLEGKNYLNKDTLGLSITKDIVNFDYTIVQDKNNKVYITSENPYVNINEIRSFQITYPKRKHWNIGPSINIGYDPINNRIIPTVGVGIQYSIISF